MDRHDKTLLEDNNRHKRYAACDDDSGELGIRTPGPFQDTAFRADENFRKLAENGS